MATTSIPSIPVELRQTLGSREARRLREGGRLPIVVYGHKQDPVHVTADYKQFTDMLHHGRHLVEIALSDGSQACLVKNVQWDAFSKKIIHVDLTRVDMSEEITVEIDLTFHGEPDALNQAGTMLEHPYTRLEVSCRADQIPDEIRVNVGDLALGDTITAGDVKLPDGVVLVTDETAVVAAVVEVRGPAEDEEAEEEAAEGAEPEVIGRGEEEEGEEEG